MLTINNEIQSEMIMYTIDELVPQESLYRKIDRSINFTFIYDEVKDLYSLDSGRPSIDPVVLFKLVFIQTIDGIKSMRKTCELINVSAEYRMFLGIPFGKKTPHFSTFSKNYERRFKDNDIFEKIFIEIVKQAIDKNLLDGATFFTDSTHKKANANKKKFEVSIEKEVKTRKEWLENEINNERVNNCRKPFDYTDVTIEKQIKTSKTDPDSGYYHRDNKENGFMYLDHRTVDGRCNIIVDCHITKGNVHDSKPYIERLKYIENTFGFKIQQVALDSGYDTMDIKKYLMDKDIFGVIGYRRYGSKESRRNKKQFEYDKERDLYFHKITGDVLEYTGYIDKNGYKKYQDTQGQFIIRRHIKEDINEYFRENRTSHNGRLLYNERKQTVERSFADSKQNHGYRYAMYRGLKKNQNYTWLICAAQNIKNIAIKVNRYS